VSKIACAEGRVLEPYLRRGQEEGRVSVMGLFDIIFFGIAAVIALVLTTFAALVILEPLITSPIVGIVFILLTGRSASGIHQQV
jgi:hypothetical protein